MVEISPGEHRVWTYLLQNPLARAEDICVRCVVPLELAQSCIDRIGTPREVFLKEAKTAQQEWEDETIMIQSEEGRKDDGGKAPYHLLAPEFLDATAWVLKFGAEKYAERNWEKGMNWSRPFSAMMRHMWAWWKGERVDPETGMSHLWHACACIMFLIAYEARATGKDDRPNT